MADRHDTSDRPLQQLLRDSAREYGYDGQTGAEFASWQDSVRRELSSILGFPEIRGRGPYDLEPERIETEAMDGYERQTWRVRTEPGFRVPFYLLLPDEGEPPYPVVLAIHGHSEDGKELTVGNLSDADDRAEIAEERRNFALQAVERGYAALAPDMRAFGELADRELDSDDSRACTRMQKTAQLFGRTLAGERTWDVLRLVDFVESRAGGRSALDADRIAITGHSGGAAVSLFAAALDDRLAPVALNAYFCTFEESIVAIDHCECNYVPGLLELGEMWTVAGLTAPRPLLIAAGAEDELFPIEGTRRAFDRLRDVYDAAAASERCSLAVGEGGHQYYGEEIWPFVRAAL